MPIKWRVADSTYKDASGSSQGKLLVAESILTANVPYYESESEHKNGNYANNYMHSQIRAYLNGFSYLGQSAEQTQWNNKGFLQTAFGDAAQQAIITTKVDNAKEQMSYNGDAGMDELYACGPTEDKIFLLSEKEVVQYSKEAYSSSGEGNSRIRVPTDFAKANYAYQNPTDGYGDYWWLRSPHCDNNLCARFVDFDGGASASNGSFVENTYYGVVPALAISF